MLLLLWMAGCSGRPEPFPDTGIEWLEVQSDSSAFVECSNPSDRSKARFHSWELVKNWGEVPQDNTIYQYTGGGLIVADLNGDSWLDLYLPTAGDGRLLLSIGAGEWSDVTEKNLPDESGLGVGGCAADADGDGDTDIYLINLHETDQLLVNDGTGIFTDGTEAAGLGGESLDGTGCTWADIDQDNDLDLLVANHYEGTHLANAIVNNDFIAAHDNKLYVNDGKMVFTDVTHTLPESFRDGYGFIVAVEDLDGDGISELYAVHDFGPMWRPNQVLRWSDDSWMTDTSLEGLDVEIFGMGVGITDLNGDRIPDFALTSWGEIAVLESSGTGSWIRSAAARGITLNAYQQTSWGADFADLDNDFDDDLLVAFGPLVMPNDVAAEIESSAGLVTLSSQPDALYIQNDDGQFEDQAVGWGVADEGIGRGFVVADIDHDGWLDVVKRDLGGQAVAWRAQCGSSESLTVELSMDGTNRQAIGATVRATLEGHELSRRIRSGGTGHASSGPPEAHFGLNGAAQIDQLDIIWPDGERSRLYDIAPGRLSITRSDP